MALVAPKGVKMAPKGREGPTEMARLAKQVIEMTQKALTCLKGGLEQELPPPRHPSKCRRSGG